LRKGKKYLCDQDLVKETKKRTRFWAITPVKEVSTKEVLVYTPKKQIGKVLL
jgi:hypothetical protein